MRTVSLTERECQRVLGFLNMILDKNTYLGFQYMVEGNYGLEPVYLALLRTRLQIGARISLREDSR